MKNINTTGDLIKALQKFPSDMPVRISIPDGREGEYTLINGVSQDHLKNQNTSGDPVEYWNEPEDLEEEDRLKEGDEHFKYQGKIVLIS